MLTDWYDYKSHCEITGTSQSGKSKFAEWCMREHVIEGNGFCLLDWHGTLYQAVLDYLAYLPTGQPVYLLNPSDPQFITPFNPFRFRKGSVSAHVDRMSDTILKPWGNDPNLMPTYERIVKMVLSLAAVSGEPIHHCAKLLEYPKKELREWAIAVIENDTVKQNWKQLQYLSLLRNGYERYLRQVESTQNRLARFVESDSVKLFTGLPGGIHIDDIVDKEAILLVNLKPSYYLSAEAGRTFAALLLSEFLHSALNHTDEERPYFLYLDECQNYLTTDAGQILDQVLKTGLRLTLIHHHAGQFHHNPALLDSLDMNAQIKVIFGGLTPTQAKMAAETLFFPELNKRWKKDDKVHYVTDHYEDSFETVTDTEGEFGSSHAVTSGSRLIPSVERIVDGQEDWTYEEKLSQLAERLTSLPRQHCYVKLPNGTLEREVPWVEPVLLDSDDMIRFMQTLPNQIPLQDAERILKEQERAFLERSKSYESRGARPKKRPPTLHEQG
ncbi:MAG TPA: hypothetical protein VNJ52_05195 [Patescibacteria group bacterium]|nr:hypothetical protein [Patescibacteria group bacterium]